MRQAVLFLCVILLNTCTRHVHTEADEVISTDDTKIPAVSVKCHGLLRHGIVAVGGETTGTTITFHGLTWELQFATDNDRELAAQHNKKPVQVIGALRKVVGTENKIRWIIDVKHISAVDSRAENADSAQVAVRGTLRAALSTTSDVPNLSVRTVDQTWNLDFAASREAQSAAELHIGQPVLLKGTVMPPLDADERENRKPRSLETPVIRVKTIEALDKTRSDSRHFE